MSKRTIFSMALAAVLVACGSESSEWPHIDKGVWQFTIEPVSSGAAAEPVTLTRELCDNPAGWFERYPSKIPLGKSGCRFSSRRLGTGAYEIESQCALLSGGTGVARGIVTLKNARAFEAKWDVTENSKPVHQERVRGTWQKACSRSSQEHEQE